MVIYYYYLIKFGCEILNMGVRKLKIDRKKIESIIAICIITVFNGQIYINPFSLWFRFSFAVVVLPLLLIYFKNVSVITTSFIVGFCMAFFRSFVFYFSNDSMTYSNIIVQFIPVSSFYIVYGILFSIFNIRKKVDNPVNFILLLWICDSIGNIVEAAIRNIMEKFPFENAVLVIILIGFIRSIVIYIVYYMICYYKKRYEREQSENKYRELLFFVSKLKTELFFLKKSINDIEDTMEKSYDLYEKIENSKLKDEALNIAKNIHEIKKDYQRVVTGMSKTLQNVNKSRKFKISEIFKIIEANTCKLIDESNKKIILKFNVIDDFYTKEIYPLISVLNNFIINSLEAIENYGEIIIDVKINGEYAIFSVTDNGIGIQEEDTYLIFEAGFSTKIDYKTGKVSSGLGLSHAKNIVEQHFDGVIKYCSQYKELTKFEITIPCSKIVFKEGKTIEFLHS